MAKKKRTANLERFNKNLRFLCKKKKLTLESLAEQVGITCKKIQRWKNNETVPSVIDAIKIADILDISIDSLLFDDLENNKRTMTRKMAPAEPVETDDPATLWKDTPDKITMCGRCQRPVDDDARYCKYCGNEIAGRRGIEFETIPVIDRKRIRIRPKETLAKEWSTSGLTFRDPEEIDREIKKHNKF